MNNGTSQIQVVASGVEQLCQELGCVPRGTLPDGEANVPGLLSNLRQLLVETQSRDQRAAVLQASVNSLAVTLDHDLRKHADSREAFSKQRHSSVR